MSLTTTGQLIVVSLFLPVTIRVREGNGDQSTTAIAVKTYTSEEGSGQQKQQLATPTRTRATSIDTATSPSGHEIAVARPPNSSGSRRSAASTDSSNADAPRPLREVADRPSTPTRPIFTHDGSDLRHYLLPPQGRRVAGDALPGDSTVPGTETDLGVVPTRVGRRPSSTPFAMAAASIIDSDRMSLAMPQPLTSLRTRSPRRINEPIERDFSFHTSTLRNGGLHNALLSAAPRLPRRTLIGTLGAPADYLTAAERAKIERALAEDGEQERRWGNVQVVWTDSAQMHGHYDQFCKQALWPMFHYTLPEYPKSQGWEADAWHKCLEVHEQFADAVVAAYRPGDVIWVNDYHLMLLPAMLRKRLPNASIGFFLHVPFPSSEVFRCLHVRREILEGVLGANLIGFQTYSFARHFLQTCARVLRVETTPTCIELDDHPVHVGIFPIGIDAVALNARRKHPQVTEIVSVLRERYEDKKIIVSRDKLDYVKGVRQKLIGFEKFLDKFPEWRGKAVLIQIALSTTEQNELNAQVSDVVSRINSRFGTIAYQPVVYLRQDIAFEHYLGLLTAADAFMITSIREGMNLTSHEFVCCQAAKRSPLLISEFAGTYGSFGAAIRVNPWDYNGMAQAIQEALSMDEEERTVRWQELYRHVTTNTAQYWVESFLGELVRVHQDFRRRKSVRFPYMSTSRIRAEYHMASKRLIFLDYDGTLAPFQRTPSVHLPIPERVEALLLHLTEDPANTVYIVSGRTAHDLDRLFANTPKVNLCAEHGCFVRKQGESSWTRLLPEHEEDDGVWRTKIREVFEYYTERTPGAFIEEKRAALVWHYRNADNPSYGAWQAAECQNHLQDMMGGMLPIHVVAGHKYIEVLPQSASDASVLQHELQLSFDTELLLAVGGSRAFEDIFEYIDQQALDGGYSAHAASLPSSPLPHQRGRRRSSVAHPGSNRRSGLQLFAHTDEEQPDSELDLPLRDRLSALRTVLTVHVGHRRSSARFSVHRPGEVLGLLERLTGQSLDEETESDDYGNNERSLSV